MIVKCLKCNTEMHRDICILSWVCSLCGLRVSDEMIGDSSHYSQGKVSSEWKVIKTVDKKGETL